MSQYMIEAIEKSAMFFVSCIVTFLDRTSPASSMAKPAAIQNTRKPPTRNSKRGDDIGADLVETGCRGVLGKAHGRERCSSGRP